MLKTKRLETCAMDSLTLMGCIAKANTFIEGGRDTEDQFEEYYGFARDIGDKYIDGGLDALYSEIQFNFYTIIASANLQIASRLASAYYRHDLLRVQEVQQDLPSFKVSVSTEENKKFFRPQIAAIRSLRVFMLLTRASQFRGTFEWYVSRFKDEIEECDIDLIVDKAPVRRFATKLPKVVAAYGGPQNKIIWNGKPAHLAVVIDTLLEKGYISFPDGLIKEKNAKMLLDMFEFKNDCPTVNSLRQLLHKDGPAISNPEAVRRFRALPHKDELK